MTSPDQQPIDCASDPISEQSIDNSPKMSRRNVIIGGLAILTTALAVGSYASIKKEAKPEAPRRVRINSKDGVLDAYFSLRNEQDLWPFNERSLTITFLEASFDPKNPKLKFYLANKVNTKPDFEVVCYADGRIVWRSGDENSQPVSNTRPNGYTKTMQPAVEKDLYFIIYEEPDSGKPFDPKYGTGGVLVVWPEEDGAYSVASLAPGNAIYPEKVPKIGKGND